MEDPKSYDHGRGDSREGSSITFTSETQIIEHLFKVLAQKNQNISEDTNGNESFNNIQRNSSQIHHYCFSLDSLLKDIGISERDFKPSVQDILCDLRKCFLRTVQLWNHPGSQNQNNILFDFGEELGVLLKFYTSESPLAYLITSGQNAFEKVSQKQLLKSQLEFQLTDKREKISLLKKESAFNLDTLEKAIQESDKRSACILPEKFEMLDYHSDFYRTKLAELKASRENDSIVISPTKINELLEKFEALKESNSILKKKLNEISANGDLPGDINQAKIKILDRKTYLGALIHQITDVELQQHDLSNSVFN